MRAMGWGAMSLVVVLCACGEVGRRGSADGGDNPADAGGRDGAAPADDADRDGFSAGEGDCCDSAADGCDDPALVNPGAFDVPGNDTDDDCDDAIDNAPDCDTGLASNSADALDHARALGLCAAATEQDPRWGVLGAGFSLADGDGDPAADSRAIRPAFGGVSPRQGASMAVLSTGHAAAPGQTSPAYTAFQPGAAMGTASAAPADWLAANDDGFPSAPGCPPAAADDAVDPIMLTIQVRVPTNARSFQLQANVLSAEFPEYVCSAVNDFFVVLLDSDHDGAPANPADGNLATYTTPADDVYPVGTNLASGNTGLFTQCVNGATGCSGTAGTIDTCASTVELAGTGLDEADPGVCDASALAGGGTGWLILRGNVSPGEVATLRIAVWDTVDGLVDSAALLDGFAWSLQPAAPGAALP